MKVNLHFIVRENIDLVYFVLPKLLRFVYIILDSLNNEWKAAAYLNPSEVFERR